MYVLLTYTNSTNIYISQRLTSTFCINIWNEVDNAKMGGKRNFVFTKAWIG